MDYISRKISSFIPSSSPPAASTNKRKASTLSNTEDPHATNNQKSSKASSSFGAPAHKRRAITLSDTEDQPPTNNHKAVKFSSVVSSSHGYRSPAIPQQRREDFKKLNEASRTTVLERSTKKAIYKPTDSVFADTEQGIQNQLLQEDREEEEDAGRGLLKKQLPSSKVPLVGQRPRNQQIWEIVKAAKTYPAAESSTSLINTKPKSIRPTLTSATRWSKQPNSYARTLLARHGNNTKALLRSLQEPLYAVRDAEIRDALWEMASQIQRFAKQHFSFQVSDEAQLRSVLPILPRETVKIIGNVASGGPTGAKGWEELFLDKEKRQALVSAIVGNVLVEQVLQHLFFGGSQVQVKQVEVVQFRLRNEDGKFALTDRDIAHP